MRASPASGGKSLSQYSQFGRSCSAIAHPDKKRRAWREAMRGAAPLFRELVDLLELGLEHGDRQLRGLEGGGELRRRMRRRRRLQAPVMRDHQFEVGVVGAQQPRLLDEIVGI